MEKCIKELLYTLDADVCGIGAIERFNEAPEGFSPLDLFSDCKSVISFGVALPKGLMFVEPRLLYGYFNEEVCKKVDAIAFKAAKEIEKITGANCVPVPCDAPNEYWEASILKAKGLISMKHTAVACGLGQLGKNTLLINPTYGNLLTVGAILTNLELESDPLCEELCMPGCRRCVDACPVHAIHNGEVEQKACRNHAYGKTERGFDTVDCNVCRKVCPLRFGEKFGKKGI